MELQIKVGGELGRISVRAWTEVLAATIKLLDELDHSGVSPSERDWVVTGLREGSLCTSITSANPMSEEALPRALETVRSLQSRPEIPPGATELALQSVIKITGFVGHRGITSIEMSDRSDKLAKILPLTPLVKSNAEEAIHRRTRAVSSFRGRLDRINVRGKRPQFSLFDERARVALRCIGDDESLTEAIKEGLGRHVSAHGELSRNSLGQPVHMRVDSIRILKEPATTVSLSDIAGIDPNWTGELTSVEFVRRQREDCPPSTDGSAME